VIKRVFSAIKKNNEALKVVFLFILLFSASLFAGHFDRYDIDEHELILSCIDRLLGIPSTSLAWPATTWQMISLISILVDFITSGPELSKENISIYVAHLYRDPGPIINTLRLLSSIVFSVSFALLYIPFKIISSSSIAAITGVIAIGTLPLCLSLSLIVTGDALSLSFVAMGFSLYFLTVQKKNRPSLCGFIFGAAIATKITALLALPFMILLIGDRRVRNGTFQVDVRQFIFWLAISFCFFNPYIWSDPLRFLKSVIGNLMRTGYGDLHLQELTFHTFLWIFFATLGAIGLFRKGYYMLFAGCLLSASILLSVFFFSVPLIRSRYLSPLIIPMGLLFTMGLAIATSKDHKNWKSASCGRISYLFPGSVLVIILILNFLELSHLIAARQAFADSIKVAQEEVIECARRCRGPIAIHFQDRKLFFKYASGRSLAAIKRTTANVVIANKKSTLFGPLTRNFWKVFQPAFIEDEFALIWRFNAIEAVDGSASFDIVFWAEKELSERFGVLDSSEVFDRLSNGEICSVVATEHSNLATLSLPVNVKIVRKGVWHIFVRNVITEK